ncbi:threonine synthase [Legionella shakespearei]|uniref:Threonine synthase n=1 Tax=Legionella shakespearei DSM 23087 TaxID=1122169 RepID=A0A0W0YXH0_9GAMM|nr:threonine synthase [Legionella shakespearei]KTD61283.1 threonine synthase [Legionella shakespearei DSM 23087]
MKSKLISTRVQDSASIDEAIRLGLARDGGLYVPEGFPQYAVDEFYQHENLADFAAPLLAPFFQESSLLIDRNFCQQVFSFPMPLYSLSENTYILELFHGPTLSFKDFGARFFAHCLQHLLQKPTTVLVATSGDTGSAVASALHNKKGIRGIILFPKDKISLRQQSQITCWGDNIHAIAISGNFDQCQQLVKQAFAQTENQDILTTANSINIARLLPQMVFYAYTSIQMVKLHKKPANFIVPSGNLGNVTACYWAKEAGFPIDEIHIANNANKVLSDYLSSGVYHPAPSVKTLANAMDVGDPSNLERLIHLFPSFVAFKNNMDVESVQDEEIKTALIDCYKKYNYILCPHTATAYHRLHSVDKTKPWIIAATAHPVKFNELIEDLLDISIPIPTTLANMLAKEQKYTEIEPVYASLQHILTTDS